MGVENRPHCALCTLRTMEEHSVLTQGQSKATEDLDFGLGLELGGSGQ